MAYNTILEERITDFLLNKSIPFEAKKMMGGLCYLVDDKMLCGIIKNNLIINSKVEGIHSVEHDKQYPLNEFVFKPIWI